MNPHIHTSSVAVHPHLIIFIKNLDLTLEAKRYLFELYEYSLNSIRNNERQDEQIQSTDKLNVSLESIKRLDIDFDENQLESDEGQGNNIQQKQLLLAHNLSFTKKNSDSSALIEQYQVEISPKFKQPPTFFEQKTPTSQKKLKNSKKYQNKLNDKKINNNNFEKIQKFSPTSPKKITKIQSQSPTKNQIKSHSHQTSELPDSKEEDDDIDALIHGKLERIQKIKQELELLESETIQLDKIRTQKTNELIGKYNKEYQQIFTNIRLLKFENNVKKNKNHVIKKTNTKL